MQSETMQLAHSDVGAGEPAILCLPGWCGGREVFAPLLAHTAQRRRSISVDWRGHGESPRSAADFCGADLVSDTVELVSDLGPGRVLPVALSHAGWVALEVRRALGPERVPGVVLMDWMPLGAPPGFTNALVGLQDPRAWGGTRGALFEMWTAGVDDAVVQDYVSSMGTYGFEMWSRAGREILRAFAAQPVPLAAFETFAAQGTPCPTLHLYAQPGDEAYLQAQQGFATQHPWFQVRRLDASSHFPCLEVPGEIAAAIDEFVAALQ